MPDHSKVKSRMTTMRVTRSSPSPLSRGEATRARIREAANQLFLRHGVEATTVEAIAAAAGVSKPTFYLYFQRKEDLLLEDGLQRPRRAPQLAAHPRAKPADGAGAGAGRDPHRQARRDPGALRPALDPRSAQRLGARHRPA